MVFYGRCTAEAQGGGLSSPDAEAGAFVNPLGGRRGRADAELEPLDAA